MKLKPKKLVTKKVVEEVTETPKKTRKRTPNTLPSDQYRPLLPPKRILVREFTQKNTTKLGKLYVEVSVRRYGADDENAPEVYLQMYQESDFYTGYKKGGSHFPLEMLYDILDILTEVSEECDEHKIC